MPNRILKESVCASESIEALTWFEEVLFYRLIVNCDDYGRFDGRPAIIKNRLFPLKENLTLKAVKNAIDKLASVGLVVLYIFEGKPYLCLPTWNEHQSIRAKRSKYPSPDDGVQTSACICEQMKSDESICPRNPIQSESESESESNNCAEPYNASAPPVALLPLNNGEEYGVSEAQLSEYADLYPAVDIAQELRNMRGWLLSNPVRRKTRNGIARFITGWLAREQDKGFPLKTQEKSEHKPGGNPFLEMLEEADK